MADLTELKPVFNCYVCDKSLANKTTLSRHLRNVHKNVVQSGEDHPNSKLACPETGCPLKFSRDAQLRGHLKEAHGINVTLEEFHFRSEEDFLNWKYGMQRETSTEYVKRTTKTLADGTKKTFMRCNRANLPRSRVTNRRKSLKSQGSNKIGKCCPAKIEVTHNDDSTLSVKFWKTHCGHTNDLGHISLDKPTKDQLAKKLQDGVTFGHILDEVRSDSLNVPKRTLLLERQDLHNIVRDYNISYSTRRHREDALSVKLWVNEMEKLGDDSPVLFHKQQGEDYSHLDKDDFVLVIMTNFQASQILKFGSSKICVDGTHGTNAYDIQLITLMTVDDFGAGCPVAYCFSNKCNEELLSLFYEKVRDKVGNVKATTFMSDDAPAFYNAWCKIMGVPGNKLLCSWHVDRCWKKNLSKVRGGSEKKSLVYKTMKVLLQHLSSKEEFNELLTKTVTNLLNDCDTRDYGEYITKHYASRPEQWAYCYRIGLGINTNMYLESFHRSLKHVYLEGKKVKRLDKTINAVMRMARDSLFKRLIKLSKQTPTDRIARINKAHKASEAIGPSAFVVIKEGAEWVVTSCTNNEQYSISKVQDVCIEPCMKCSQCLICIHCYKCSCHDNVIKMNICKHIHALCSVFPLSNSSSQVYNFNDNEVSLLIDQSETNHNVETNQKLANKANAISDLLKTTKLGSSTHKLIEQKLDNVLSLLNNIRSEIEPSSKLSCKAKINTTQKIEPQVRFFSTKKKVKSLKRLKKPTYNERLNIVEGLKSESQVILNVHTENDHTYDVNK